MHSFTTLTLASACFTALTAAVPHARQHYKLHANRNADLEPQVVKLAPLAGRQVPGTFQLSPIGECGGSSGYGCGDGFCCSKWGYCGTSEAYCGDGGSISNSTSEGAQPGRPGPPPMYSGSPLPAGWGAPTAGSSAAAAPSSAAPAPSGYAPAPSGYAPTPSGGASSAAPAPSSAPPAPSSAGGAPSSAPAYSAPVPSASSGSGSGSGSFSGYKMYTGSGAPSAGWPSMDQWMDFDTAFSASEANMKVSCAQWDQENDSDQEVSEIKSAIQSISSSSGVDSRFVLAIMMQESNGCVRVQTTDNGVTNPGLFQSHNGAGTCWHDGTGTNPCPASEITQMVKDGVEGTPDGDGLKQTLAQGSGPGSEPYYQAAVIYNSGNLPSNLDDNTATPCYASDVANRLMGWTQGTSGCTL